MRNKLHIKYASLRPDGPHIVMVIAVLHSGRLKMGQGWVGKFSSRLAVWNAEPRLYYITKGKEVDLYSAYRQ